MIGGVIAGYICDFLANKISVKKEFSAIYQLIVVPLLSILIIGLLMVFVIELFSQFVKASNTHVIGCSITNTINSPIIKIDKRGTTIS